jgi:hypothetical protein
MNRILYTFVAIVSLLSSHAWAGEAQTHEQLNDLDEQAKIFEMLDEAEIILKKMDREFRTSCAKAVGYEPFCNCIASNTPSAWGFSGYIAITTRTKEENGYSTLTAERKLAYDKVLAVRDQCVALINKKP